MKGKPDGPGKRPVPQAMVEVRVQSQFVVVTKVFRHGNDIGKEQGFLLLLCGSMRTLHSLYLPVLCLSFLYRPSRHRRVPASFRIVPICLIPAPDESIPRLCPFRDTILGAVLNLRISPGLWGFYVRQFCISIFQIIILPAGTAHAACICTIRLISLHSAVIRRLHIVASSSSILHRSALLRNVKNNRSYLVCGIHRPTPAAAEECISPAHGTSVLKT